MKSVVEELQRGALDRQTPVSDLLRMAKVISIKLKLPDLAKWVDNELSGYGKAEIPAYRVINVHLKGKNPFHGWLPVIIDDEKLDLLYKTYKMPQPVAEIEHLLSKLSSRSYEIVIPLSGPEASLIMSATGVDSAFAFMVSSSEVWSILDAVRNELLDWSLQLEQAGIKGEGLSFSDEERSKAHESQATYNIGNIGSFTGNLGANSGTVNVASHQDPARVLSLLERIKANEESLNLSSVEAQRLKAAMDDLTYEIKQPMANQSKVQHAVSYIRNIAENATGSLVATGILYELGKLFP